MSKSQTIKVAFVKSVPILCSFIFVGIAYGMMMEQAGFDWYYSLFASFAVYTGAFQFVLITFLSSSASILTILLTALLMNSRQTFYALTFVDEFKRMGKRKPYMILTLTDETYAVNCSLPKDMENKHDVMFYVAMFSKTYWIIGSVIGGIAGQLIPFELEGIDFCMTALFVIIFIGQWEQTRNHVPAIIGGVIAVICLVIFGDNSFMLPALLVTSGVLMFKGRSVRK